MKRLSLVLPVLLAASPASAQWRSTSYALKAGWNAVYLNGDAAWRSVIDHFTPYPDVVEVWRWNPNPSQVQYTDSPSEPAQGTAEWSVWRRGQPDHSDLALLTGQSSYLVKLRDGAAPLTLPLLQRAEPPALQWMRTGPNLLGFPSRRNAGVFPAFSSYFSTMPVATASKVYRYNGGPLDGVNPLRLFSFSSERVDSTQAYWFEAKTVSDFIGPLHLSLSEPAGLIFGHRTPAISLTLRNRTAVAQTLTFTPVESEAAPPGQPAIAGPVALTRRIFNTSTAQYDETPVAAPFSQSVAANGSVTLTFGVNRAAMNGAPGSFFASLLRMTDAANMMDVYLPVSAGATSLAGLWVGDAAMNAVQSLVPGSSGTSTARVMPLRYLIHVNAAGQATLLSQVCIGTLAAAPNDRGIATMESALKADERRSAIRLTSAHMPLDRVIPASGSFGPGATFTGTINLPFNDPVNPFVHQYHPDHDNRDERLNPLSAGRESYTVNRVLSFTAAATAPAGLSGGWGSRVLAGTCTETITGLHREAITVTGTFTLRRVDENPVLITP